MFTKTNDSERIAGWNTAADWHELRGRLTVAADRKLWHMAFEQFFLTRLELRYLHPIKTLQDNGTFTGEGFAIAAIQCSLVEFLESTVQGLNFRHRQNGRLGPHEYSSSGTIFKSFLTRRVPFSGAFSSTLAADFYLNVRCSLFHEARTKGWRIHARDVQGRIVDSSTKTLFRDHFQDALLAFIQQYGRDLIENPTYQAAFVRKFDDLCEPAG